LNPGFFLKKPVRFPTPLAPETPLDPAALLGNAGDMAAEMPVERRRPRDEGEAQVVVGQREALAIGAGDHLAAGGWHVGEPALG
jgi:hypothetical protein